MSRTALLPTTDGPMAAFDAEPAGQVRGGIVVLQDAFGVNDYLEGVCAELAGEGYRAVAPHLYHRTGDPTLPYGPAESTAAHFQALDEPGLLDDLRASIDYLAGQGIESSRTGVVGFCQGGSVAFLAAVRFSLGAVVTFYGGGIGTGRFGMPPLLELAPDLKSPWLGLYGDLDLPSDHGSGIPVAEVEALREAASTSGVPTEVVRYPEAGHAFHAKPRPHLYHEASAKDAWQRALVWLARYLPDA
jgi:carboxymethylenebutenolidase